MTPTPRTSRASACCRSRWKRRRSVTPSPARKVRTSSASRSPRSWPATRPLCTRAEHGPRHLKLQPRAEHEALRAARGRLATKEGRRAYARRAGIEGTLSQGVRAFGLRRSRYRGLARTHLQHVATAAAIDLARL